MNIFITHSLLLMTPRFIHIDAVFSPSIPRFWIFVNGSKESNDRARIKFMVALSWLFHKRAIMELVLDITRLFHPGKANEIKLAINNLVECLSTKVDKTNKRGWLYEHFECKNISRQDIYFYLCAVLAVSCKENSEVLSKLCHAIFDLETNVFSIDASFICQVMTSGRSSEKTFLFRRKELLICFFC